MTPLRKLAGVFFIVVILAALLAQFGRAWQPVFAQEEVPTPGPPVRRTTITVEFTGFEWWLIRWKNNRIACRLTIEHEGRPFAGEIAEACDEKVYEEWLATPPCTLASQGGDTSKCTGLYLHQASGGKGEKTVEIELPLPEVWLTVDGCDLQPPENRCESLPSLILTGVEPLPNEVIIQLQGRINGQPFSCPGFQCAIPLQPTGTQGIFIEFWADSSYGDSSKVYTAQVRALPWGDFMAPEGGTSDNISYYIDIISSQYREGSLTSCTDIWQVFPEVGGAPPWLSTPNNAQELESAEGFYYLAGMLIQYGAVDAQQCPNGGLAEPGVANNCGVQAAMPELVAWQNQFNQDIIDVAQDTGIPAQLMKNIFSRESQFWPGLYKTYLETGLGQMTENGADTLLLWNPDFFAEFCPLVLDRYICDQRTYGGMTDPEVYEFYDQYLPILRGALVARLNSSCDDCPVGIDMTQARFSIRVFAETLLANCNQVSQMIFNTTEKMPGQVSSFVDLWKFTLVNYNAGPGCLGSAIEAAWDLNGQLNWRLVSSQLDETCSQSIGYVENISSVPVRRPTATPIVILRPPTEVPVEPPPPPAPIFTPGPSPTPQPTPTFPPPGGTYTPTPTATSEG